MSETLLRSLKKFLMDKHQPIVYTSRRYCSGKGRHYFFALPFRRSSSIMKVILLRDVEGLGKAGDLKEVANGYARNYLLPRRLAAGATPSLLANRDQRIAAEKRRLEKAAEANRQLAERLAEITLTFKARVGRQGRLYGSITSQDIAAALRDAY